jgi:hypothetical protein
MRLMLILDWWELVMDFIGSNPEVELLEAAKQYTPTHPAPQPEQQEPYELTLNITDSDVVLVEDCSQWDTNALILKVNKSLNFINRVIIIFSYRAQLWCLIDQIPESVP